MVDTLALAAPGLSTDPLRVRVYLPPAYDAAAQVGYPVLLVNDGQDMEAVGMQATLASLYAAGDIRPVIVVAVDMPTDRMGAYGLSDRAAGRSVVAQTKYGPVGAQAHAYSQWVVQTLLPAIDARYRTRTTPDARGVLGWSLGALSAFNLGWQYPDTFSRVGAFSPSFWLSADRSDAAAVQRTRLAQTMVATGEARWGLKQYIAVGTREEADDRDGDGVNDALDDARDLVEGWHEDGQLRAKGLRQLGYGVNTAAAVQPTRADVALAVLEAGEHNQAAWARMLPGFLRWAYAVQAPPINATGTVESYQDLPSRHVAARTVDVWLPPGYATHPQRRYPVLYMHDGQNLFDPALSYTGIDWGVDEAMTRLIARGDVREAIVVGIWNTPLRGLEYTPLAPLQTRPAAAREGLPIDGNASDAYVTFLVDELKPFIDARYRTQTGPGDTLVMGSSLGGLISLYAMAQHPQVFGGVGAVSTHWPVGDGVMVDWFGAHLPDPRTHRIWFDHGTATLDAQYAPFQRRMDALMRTAGYVEGDNWASFVDPGAEHNERAWRGRLERPLRFLLPPAASERTP
ncbi:alpha/beta hydrolase-fold protein [Agrilutibacter solisilvae]|uniref:Esterase n=1 Tax=Agrilutibacter solisilvae TaxID=2763317 RepID=A0A974Y2E5_9GAMM|nr:alpha/beta hydrolase-fold protein [Lysobacter solisilvae]QSX79340.1 hypothetical protein I8J32_005575 [Lysobacter solisilvae]